MPCHRSREQGSKCYRLTPSNNNLATNPKLKITAKKMHRAIIILTVSKIMKKLKKRSKFSLKASDQMSGTKNGKTDLHVVISIAIMSISVIIVIIGMAIMCVALLIAMVVSIDSITSVIIVIIVFVACRWRLLE